MKKHIPTPEETATVYRMLHTQAFADWYGDGGKFDNHIRGEEGCSDKAGILKNIEEMLTMYQDN